MVTILTILFIALNIADIYLTNKIISSGGRELNPIMSNMMDRLHSFWWIAKAVLGLIVIVVTVCLYIYIGRWWGIWFMACVDMLYCWIVWNNWNEIRRK